MPGKIRGLFNNTVFSVAVMPRGKKLPTLDSISKAVE